MSYDGGSFAGLNTALRGLLTEQAAMDVTGHNIDNMNTVGYSRQSVEFATTTPYTLPALNDITTGQIGTGVQVEGYSRARDQYLDQAVRTQYSTQTAVDGQTASLDQVQSVFSDLSGNGISDDISAFFNSMSALSSDASNMSLRQTVVQKGQKLANDMNQVSNQLTQVATSATNAAQQDVTDINTISSQIGTLNKEIRNSELAGQTPNDLLDQRDALLDQLSQKANITITEAGMPTGTVQVTFNMPDPTTNINLVDPTNASGYDGTNPLTLADAQTAYAGVPGPPALAPTLTGGDLYAQLNVANAVVPQITTQLDTLTNALVTDTNAQSALGYDLQGNAGTDMFNAAGTTAATMQFSSTMLADPSLIAAAASTGVPPAVGDGGNALTLSQLEASTADASIGNQTFSSYYSTIIGGVGNLVSLNQSNSANQDAVTTSLTNRQQSVSGVSLDEEMSNMLKYQQSYNAAARILTVFDDELNTVVNKMGEVGL